MLTAPTKWVRVSRSQRCPVCGHADWCLLATDNTLALCPRTPSPRWVGKNGGGYLHKLGPSAAPAPPPAPPPRMGSRSRAEMVDLMRKYQTAVNPARLERLARGLGVTAPSLRRLGIGWAFDKGAWAFPMLRPDGPLLGIRLRRQDGRKFAVTGGREGLFIPSGLSGEGPLLLCEGPTSCAALLDLDFDAVGRPSCSGGVQLVQDYLRRGGRRDVVVFGDNDEPKRRPDGSVWKPGQDGAERLACEVLPLARSVKVVVPPFVNDPRDWKREGATHDLVSAVMHAANYWSRN